MGNANYFRQEAPVAEWVKRWVDDLAFPSSIPRGEIFLIGIPLHQVSLSSFHDLDIIEKKITVDKGVKSNRSHPSMLPSKKLHTISR